MGLVRRDSLMDAVFIIGIVIFFLLIGGIVIYKAICDWKSGFDDTTDDMWDGYWQELENKEKKEK